MGLPGAFVELIFDLADDISRLGNWFRINPIAGLGVLFLVIFFGWFADRWFANSEIFKADFWEGRGPEGIRNLVWAMATVFAGAAGLYGLYLAGRRTAALDRQAQIAHDHRVLVEQGQITERFTKAVEQLGADQMAARLGAIYALERVVRESTRDRPAILNTLAAFARQRAPWPPKHEWQEPENAKLSSNSMSSMIDVAAAVSVLARSVGQVDAYPDRLSDGHDLRTSDLRGMDFRHTNFSRFFLWGSNLSGSGFRDVLFVGSRMLHVTFKRSYCFHADFTDAEISFGSFEGAHLTDAKFDGADLTRVSFKNAQGLKPHQLVNARYASGDPPINLPEGVSLPENSYDP